MSQRITPSLIIEGIHIPFNGTSNDMSTPNHWSRNTNSSAQVPTEGICFPFNGTSNNLSTPNHWSRNAYSSPQVPTGGIHIPFNGTSSDMSMPNQWSRNIYSSPQMPIEMDMLNYAQGIHIPFNGTFGDTSTPNSLAGQEIMGTIPDQLAPITPERGARVTNHNLSLGPRNVLDGGLNNEKRQDESVPCLVCSATQVNQPINLYSREEVSLSSTAILSTTQLKEVHSLREGEGLQGIDLNKTPQKSRRKKHRPKVVIEGKPQKTPKPVTPQQTIKKEKRKYVRKTPPKEKPVPSAHVGEVDESVGPRDTVRSSCRRFLNFNTEVPVAKGSSVDSGPTVLPVKTDPQFQLQDICEGSQNNILGLPNSNQKLSQGLEVVAETSTAGFAFDLNHSLSQMLGGYFLLPLNPNPSPPIARIDLGKENTDITGRNRNMKSMPLRLHTATTDCTIIPTILPAPQFVARTQVNSNNNSHLRFANELPLGKGLKRNYCETIGPNHLGSMNLLGANLFSSNASQKINQDDNTHPSSTDKKRRTDVRPNEETTKVSSSVMGGAGCDAHTLQTSQSRGLPQCNNMEGKHKLHGISANYLYDGYSHPMTGPYNYTAPKFSHVFAFADSERRPLPQCNSLQEIHKLHSITSNYGYDGYSHPMTGPYNFIAPNYPHVITFTEAERRPFFNPLQDLEGIVSPVHNETQKKKRSKVPVSVCNLAPITAVTQVKQFPPSDGTKVSLKAQESHSQGKLKIKKQAKKLPTNSAKSLSYYSSNQAGLQGGDVATCNNHQSFTESSDALGQKSFEPTSSSSQSRRAPKLPNHFVHSRKATAAPHSQAHRSVPFNDPIDEIIWRLKSMNISESETSEAQNKLVLYGGDKQMVPHEGPFDPFKKRRPRPKVDLDEETNRVWRLLMWKEGSDEMGGMDAAKEKWWEEERRVFRGRTDSFIARMHLVQGDRRFSRWKGSVVDSVIGVFLTQNVSDHLSSSAFMALAARFPLLPRTNNDRPDPEGTSKSLDEPEVSILNFEKWQEKKLHKGVCNQGFMTLNEAQKTEEKEMASSIESLGSNMGPIGANYSTGKQIAVIDNGSESSRESPRDRAETPRVPQDMVSSQSSVISSENSTDSKKQIVDQTLSSSESNSEAENTVIGPNSNGYYGCNFTSFMELLNMQGAHEFHEFNDQRNDTDIMPSNDSFEGAEFVMSLSKLGESLASTQPSTCQTKPHYNQTKEGFIEHRGSECYSEAEDTLTGPKSNEYDFGATSFMELLHMQGAHVFQELDTRRNDAVPSNVSFEGAEFEIRRSSLDGSLASSPPSTCQAMPHHIQTKGVFEDNGPVTAVDEVNIVEASADESKSCALSTTSEVAVTKSISCTDKVDRSTVDDGVRCFQNESMSESCAQVRQHLGCLLPESETTSLAEALAQRRNSKQLDQSNLSNYDTVEERLDALESSSLVNKEKVVEQKAVESNKLDELCSSNKESREPSKGGLRSSKRTVTKTAFDWDSLRRQACCNGSPKERSHDAMDSLDYEAVRCADVNEISDSIRARGMNNMLAERMKDFLNRLVRDHGSLDLEWLRDVPPDKAKDYLLSIRGLGLKSVECVRLLTLHHLAFPVDTNVGRICVRLGWVPLQPLPESLQLHLLELYPVLESIQKYLWPRLCKLDQRTLYELHYQMITFGKVFCTKSRPNCNACPMRAECRHFASAFASARLALPGPEEKSLVTSAVPLTNSDRNHKLVTNETSLPLLEKAPHSQAEFGTTRCEPIIEEPASPEPENFDASESAIEDAFWEQDPDEIPTIKLNFKEFSQNLQNYMQENHIQLHDVDMSKALVAITPEAASIPMPKLKNVSRLRTEHLVYELPDSHILLKGLDPREPDDPSPYLLAIWTPGETAQSIQPPEMSCNTSESGNLCDKNTCFACNSIREADAKTVRGTLLIPCRTAMRGSFPLNGTYFQVNEVFADHDSSLQPIDVPRAWIWNLPRRTVYFGTSVPTIFRGLTTEGIQHCFWKGFVCVRGFDQKTRAPRPLMARLHFPASKLARGKKSPNKPPE